MDNNGYIKLYDEPHKKWFEGIIENGICCGECKEYDESGNIVFRGFYDNGKKLRIEMMKERKGYQKEYDEQNHLVNIKR